MSGATPPLPNTSSWRGAWLITGTALPFTFMPKDESGLKFKTRQDI